MIALILLFWLAVAGWYVAREIAPHWGKEEAPPFHIDLTDEVGRPSIDWDVYSGGAKVGDLTTSIRRLDADRFELAARFRSNQLKVLGVEIRMGDLKYTVTPDGALLAASVKLKARQILDIDLNLEGPVEDGVLRPTASISLGGEEMAIPVPEVKIPPGASVFNTMLPLHRIPHLREGRTWTVRMMNPVGEVNQWVSRDVDVPEIQALTRVDTLTWNQEDVPAFKIEYRAPGKETLKAVTWVRKSDGVVLRQEAFHEGTDIVLVRKPSSILE